MQKSIPGFPENKTGLVLIFTLKYDSRAYFWGCVLYSSIKNKVTKQRIMRFPNIQ